MEAPSEIVNRPKILDRPHLRDYSIILLGLGVIITIYHLLFGRLAPGMMPSPLQPPQPPNPNQPPTQASPDLQTFSAFWPLWGTLIAPDLTQVLSATGILLLVGSFIWKVYPKLSSRTKFLSILLICIGSIILTNAIQGLEKGIYGTIGGGDSIYQDAITITSVIDFISNYESLQPTLTTHALTQPPGAVLSIYLFYVLFRDPGFVAIGLAVTCTSLSLVGLKQIFLSFFSEEMSNYGALMFGFLPAIQVYYLANVYAIVSTLAILALYLYLHEDRRISYVGTSVVLFLGTFTSFLFCVIPLCFLLYEILLVFWENLISSKNGVSRKNVLKPILLSGVVLSIYIFLEISLGFNYLSAFLYASSSENPQGFMLFSDPIQYVVTRFQDILDIVVFLGPVLMAFCCRGVQQLRTQGISKEHLKLLSIAIAAFVALVILFLTGAPKKGETARICMFILPFVLLPILHRMDTGGYSIRQQQLLLSLVFIQAGLMQLVGMYIW